MTNISAALTAWEMPDNGFSAQQRLRELPRIGGLQIFQLFADTDEVNRDRPLPRDGAEHTALGGAVELRGPLVSRAHAMVSREHGAYSVRDLDSSNGTFVNGLKVRRQVLRHEDVIRVGDCELRFLDDSAPKSTPLHCLATSEFDRWRFF